MVLWGYLEAKRKPIFWVILFAYGVRVLATIVNLYVVKFPGHKGGDATAFENHGWKLANLQWDTFIDAFQLGDPYLTYGWIIGLIYRVVGHSILVPHFLNAFLGALVVLLVFKTTRILWNENAAYRAMWVAALFPSFIHYHSILLREVWVALGFTLSIYFFAKYLYRSRSIYDALISLLAMGFATVFHGGMVAGLGGLLLYFLWRSIVHWRDLMLRSTGASRSEFVTTTLLVGVTLPLLIYGFVSGVDINKVGDLRQLVEPETLAKRATQVAQARMRGGASYPSLLSVQGAGELVVKTVPRTMYLLFSPFPWDVRKPVHAIAMLDSLIYIVLFYSIFANWRYIKRERALLIFVVLLPLLLAFSMGTSNFGAAMRHRAKMVSLVICVFPVFPGVGMFREERNRG